jgi:hypothetical protein
VLGETIDLVDNCQQDVHLAGLQELGKAVRQVVAGDPDEATFAIANSPNNAFWYFSIWAIPLLGMLTSALALAGIAAAWIQLTGYRAQLDDAYNRLQEDWPRVGATEWVNRFAMLYPLCVPAVFFGAWLVGLVLALYVGR